MKLHMTATALLLAAALLLSGCANQTVSPAPEADTNTSSDVSDLNSVDSTKTINNTTTASEGSASSNADLEWLRYCGRYVSSELLEKVNRSRFTVWVTVSDDAVQKIWEEYHKRFMLELIQDYDIRLEELDDVGLWQNFQGELDVDVISSLLNDERVQLIYAPSYGAAVDLEFLEKANRSRLTVSVNLNGDAVEKSVNEYKERFFAELLQDYNIKELENVTSRGFECELDVDVISSLLNDERVEKIYIPYTDGWEQFCGSIVSSELLEKVNRSRFKVDVTLNRGSVQKIADEYEKQFMLELLQDYDIKSEELDNVWEWKGFYGELDIDVISALLNDERVVRIDNGGAAVDAEFLEKTGQSRFKVDVTVNHYDAVEKIVNEYDERLRTELIRDYGIKSEELENVTCWGFECELDVDVISSLLNDERVEQIYIPYGELIPIKEYITD